jgi:hypothetical protein
MNTKLTETQTASLDALDKPKSPVMPLFIVS